MIAQKHTLWFYGFAALLMLVPLPFGAARPWASDLLGLITGLALTGMLAALPREGLTSFTGAPWRRLMLAGMLFGLALLWGYAQTLNGLLAPSSVQAMARQVLRLPVAATLSLTPDEYAESALRLLTYSGGFLIAFMSGRDADRAYRMLKILCLASVAYALYGLMMQSTGLRMILWYDKWAYQDFVTSVFVNKNSYATYAGIGLQACLAWLWVQMKALEPSKIKRADVAAVLTRDFTGALFAVVILLGALILTGSRGGIVSSLTGCLTLGIGLAVNRRWGWKIGWVFAGLLGVFIASVGLIGSDIAFDRLTLAQLGDDAALRQKAYSLCWQALLDHPWRGYGLGSFVAVFQLYRDAAIPVRFEHAHNDYLELMLELGIPAAGLVLAAILLLLSACLQGIKQRRRHEVFPVLALGVTVSVGLHSLIDFGMQIPAIAFTYAAVLGFGVAQSWSSRSAP